MLVLHSNSTKPTQHFFGGKAKRQFARRWNRTKYNHDNLRRLGSITHSSAGTLAGYAYDGEGQLDQLTGGPTTDFAFDGVGRLEGLAHDLAGSSSDNTYGLVYSPASQIRQLTSSNAAYAPIVLMTNESYTVNGLNQYTNVAGTAHGYDANGNLTSDGQTSYLYDQENRLVKGTATSGGAIKAELWYDPLGRLHKIQGGGNTTHLLYDGDELIAEYNGTGTSPTQRYVHGISVDDPIAWFEGAAVTSSSRRHIRSNHQGSIVAITDTAGANLHTPQYDSWGSPSGTPPLRFGFTGQAWIGELGLWHYKARAYSPKLGRFMQTDPIGYEDQVNVYIYVANDPINSIDPNGRSKKQLLKAGVDHLREIAEARRIKNARARGRRAALENERNDLIETGTSRSDLTQARQQELVETGNLKNMDGHHEPSISSGQSVDEKVAIAENPDHITFMEKSDHQELHSELGGTRVPIKGGGDIVTGVLAIAATALEALSYIPDPTMIFEPTEMGCSELPENCE